MLPQKEARTYHPSYFTYTLRIKRKVENPMDDVWVKD